MERLPSRTAHYILFTLFFASFLAFLDRQLLNILVAPIRADIGISDVQFSLLQGAAFALVYCIAAFPIAHLSDRFSRKLVLLVSIIVWSSMTLLFGLADSYLLLLLARMGVAVGEAGLSPAAISLVRQVYPQHRQSIAVAILTLSVYVGGGVSMIVGGPALAALEAARMGSLAELAPWRLLFIACGSLGVIGVLLLVAMPEPPRAKRSGNEATFGEFIRTIGRQKMRVTAYLAASTGLNALVYAVLSWTPAMLMRTHGWNASDVGLSYGAVYMLGGAIGGLGAGQVVGRLVRHDPSNAVVMVLRLAAVLLAGGTIAAALLEGGATALVFTAVGMVGVGAMVALGAFGFQTMFPDQFSARAVALNFLIPGTLGASLGPSAVPLLAGLLGGEEQLGLGLAVFAGAMALWAVLWFSLFLRAPALSGHRGHASPA